MLLDAHVYLNCNSWVSAADSMYGFLNSCFNYIKYNDILNLIETAFYRVLFCFYIYRNGTEKGVMLPDYAMSNIEPAANFKAKALNKQYRVYEIH